MGREGKRMGTYKRLSKGTRRGGEGESGIGE